MLDELEDLLLVLQVLLLLGKVVVKSSTRLSTAIFLVVFDTRGYAMSLQHQSSFGLSSRKVCVELSLLILELTVELLDELVLL